MFNFPLSTQIKLCRKEDYSVEIFVDKKRLNHTGSTTSFKHYFTSGFEWGYGGAGPHETALEVCRQLYGLWIGDLVDYEFCERFVSRWDREQKELVFRIDLQDFNAWIRSQISFYDVEMSVYWNVSKEWLDAAGDIPPCIYTFPVYALPFPHHVYREFSPFCFGFFETYLKPTLFGQHLTAVIGKTLTIQCTGKILKKYA